jgi:hypothetical protein
MHFMSAVHDYLVRHVVLLADAGRFDAFLR